MKGRVLLLAMLLLAGCVGSEGSVEELPAAEVAPAEEPLPDGREGVPAARNETDRVEEGAGGSAHAHDYWEGRTRVVLADARVMLRACCFEEEGGTRAEPFSLEDGALVYEGTGHLEVTISEPQRVACTNFWLGGTRVCSGGAPVDDPTGATAQPRLLVRDAMALEPAEAGALLWDAPLVIPIDDPRKTDMPHSTVTRWGFEVRSDDAADEGLTFRILIEAVRDPSREVPRWPGHPDLYAESLDRVVLEMPEATTSERGLVAFLGDDPRTPMHPPERLIGWGTKVVHVWANVTEVRSENPALEPGAWVLAYRDASGALLVAKDAAHTGEVRELHWVIEVTPDAMDNPYAVESRWGFQLVGLFDVRVADEAQFSCSGGCASYDVDHALVVHASARPLPAA